MPTEIKCPCGKRLLIPEGTAAKKFLCPACRTVLHVPQDPAEPALVLDADLGTPPADAEAPLQPVEGPTEVYPEREKPTKKHRQQAKVRRQGLNQVNRGLAVHYASTFAVYGSIWAAIIAALFMLAARLGDAKSQDVMGFFFCASSVLLILAGLIELTTFVLCLWLPDSVSRRFLFGSMAVWAPVLALAIWVLWPDDHRPFALGGAFFVVLGAWTLWMLFVRRLAFYLHQDEIALEAVRNLVRGLVMMLVAVLLLTGVILLVHLFVYVKYPFARGVLAVVAISTLLGLMRIAAATRFFESILHFFLFPTGILFVFKYLDLIGSLRMIIWRRA